MLILALQYHQQDRAEALRLAKFIAEIEPQRRHDIEFVFVRRWDAAPVDDATLAHVAEKFRVSQCETVTRWTGWPAGPNAMAVDFLTRASWLNQPGGEWENVSGILLLEPDCVPLSANWLDQIIRSWDFACIDQAWCMGSWRNSGGEFGHINGCAVYRTDFAKLVGLHRLGENDIAWDCWHSQFSHKHWARSGLFLNRFQERNATEEILRTPEIGGVPPVLAHGYKDDSCYNIARQWLLQPVQT